MKDYVLEYPILHLPIHLKTKLSLGCNNLIAYIYRVSPSPCFNSFDITATGCIPSPILNTNYPSNCQSFITKIKNYEQLLKIS